jgi:ribosomal protein S18 acetylase RimI-like enzyme
MRIRLADKNDTQEIAEIIRRHFEEDYMGFASFDEKYIREKMKKDAFFVAEENEIITGCIRVSIVDLDLGEIRQLCVDKEFRSKGIAQKLLETAVSFLKERKMRKLIVRCKSDNKDAIRLWEKNGFRQEGYFKEHYRKGIDVIQLYRFL